MNMLVKITISSLLRILLDNKLRENLLREVANLMDSDIPGDEKRARVKQAMIAAGTTIAGYLLNLCIELAVAWLRAQGEK